MPTFEPGRWLFVTHFNSRYLSRAVVMARSLHLASPGATICAICLDDTSFRLLGELKLGGVMAVSAEDFETPELLKLKSERSVAEYCWTCTPHVVKFALDKFPEAESATYLDADLFFFSDPGPIFGELGGGKSVLITEHRFRGNAAELERRNGRFNVQYLTFRRDAAALGVLERWRRECSEWCGDAHDGEKYGDQKYLDKWPAEHGCVAILRNIAVCLAPWNILGHQVAERGGRVVVDGVTPLVFYHFQSLKIHGRGEFTLAVDYQLRDCDRRLVYRPYLAELEAAMEELAALGFDSAVEFVPSGRGGLVNRLKVLKRRLLGKDNYIRTGKP